MCKFGFILHRSISFHIVTFIEFFKPIFWLVKSVNIFWFQTDFPGLTDAYSCSFFSWSLSVFFFISCFLMSVSNIFFPSLFVVLNCGFMLLLMQKCTACYVNYLEWLKKMESESCNCMYIVQPSSLSRAVVSFDVITIHKHFPCNRIKHWKFEKESFLFGIYFNEMC